MQTTPNGEYTPCRYLAPGATKELDTSFKIPKRKLNLESEMVSRSEQVMEDSYYNYISEKPARVVQLPQVDAARNLILQSLQRRDVEKPKTYLNCLLRETIPDCFDETLPQELIALFQPLYCKLCSVQLSSNIVAKLHYKSKNHEKKIRKFLIGHSERTGEPLHKRAKIAQKVDIDDGSNPLYFYCDVCDLTLTGKLHAESHYMGKSHTKATLGVKTPAGKGHYDNSGKWIREGPSHKKLQPNNEDNFGTDFRTNSITVTAGFRCELCNITTTCQEQLNNHYNGQKHMKKLKQQSVEGTDGQSQEIAFNSLLAKDGNCSGYRTPSGQYYCQICDASSNSEAQFKQHLHSKNHLKKTVQKKS